MGFFTDHYECIQIFFKIIYFCCLALFGFSSTAIQLFIAQSIKDCVVLILFFQPFPCIL